MSETPKRPGVVLAAAIIMFIFGGLAVLGSLGAVVPYVTPPAPPAPKNLPNQPPVFVDPTAKLVQEEPGIMGVITAFTLLGALLGAVKIWIGVGILQLRPSARTAGIIVSILTILTSIAQSVYSALYFVPAYLRILARDNGPPFTDFLGLFEGGLWIATGFGVVFTFALWLTVILLLNSRRSRNAFAGISDMPADEPEPEPRSRFDGYDDEDDDGYPRSSPKNAGDTGIKDGSN